MEYILLAILHSMKPHAPISKILETYTYISMIKKNNYATYNKSKAIIKANRAVASEKAKPKIAYENN